MPVWLQQIQSSLMMDQMALAHHLIPEALQFQTNQPQTGPHTPRPDSSCSFSSNSSLGKEVQIVAPIHNRNFQESRYKTELCRHYEEMGQCPHGLQCLFAHGQQELRPFRGRHRKFKTQLCKAFHSEGFCSFGPRCSYIHSKPNPETLIASIQAIAPQNQVFLVQQFDQLDQFDMNPMDESNGCRLSVFAKMCEES